MIISDAMEKFSMNMRDIFSLTYGQLSLLLEGAYMKHNIDENVEYYHDDYEDFGIGKHDENGHLDADTINAFFGG